MIDIPKIHPSLEISVPSAIGSKDQELISSEGN